MDGGRHIVSHLLLGQQQQPRPPPSVAIFLPRRSSAPLKYMTYVLPHYAPLVGWPVGFAQQHPTTPPPYLTPMPAWQAGAGGSPSRQHPSQQQQQQQQQEQQMLVPFRRSSPSALPSPDRECKFCKNNGEPKLQYRTHLLRHPETNQLICPVLREHVCEECGATGDDAHTRNYCPSLKKKLRQALPMSLKRTRRQSDGTIRQ